MASPKRPPWFDVASWSWLCPRCGGTIGPPVHGPGHAYVCSGCRERWRLTEAIEVDGETVCTWADELRKEASL